MWREQKRQYRMKIRKEHSRKNKQKIRRVREYDRNRKCNVSVQTQSSILNSENRNVSQSALSHATRKVLRAMPKDLNMRARIISRLSKKKSSADLAAVKELLKVKYARSIEMKKRRRSIVKSLLKNYNSLRAASRD